MAFRSSTQNDGSGTGTTATVSVPAGAATDDIAILCLNWDISFDLGVTWPTGFTQLTEGDIPTPDGTYTAAAWKRLTGADSGTYTISVSAGSGNDWIVQCALFSGRDTTNPPVSSTIATDANSNASPVSITSNGVTAVDGDDLLWCGAADVSSAPTGSGFSPPSTFTEREETLNGGAVDFDNMSIATKDNVSAGATGTITGTFTHTATGAGFIAALIRIPAAAGGAAAPFIPIDASVEVQPSFPVSLRTWAASYNPNLVGKDVFPPGRKGILYDDPSRGYLPAGPTWTWQYNQNLVGKDVFPAGRRNPVFEEVQPLFWRREWTQNLLLSTLAVTVQRPFNQYSWPLPRIAPQPDRTQTESLVLTTLMGQDVFPPGRQRFDRPQPVTWLQGWTQNLLLSTLTTTIATPFNQFNWPLPIRTTQPDRTQIENLVLTTLLSQDAFPPGQQRTETPQPVSWRRDWTQSLVLSTLSGQDSLPPGAVSNRILVAAPQQRDWAQNLLLSTLTPVIQTPLNQYDWPVPIRPTKPGQTWTLNLLLSTLAPAIVLPLNQYDWPVPQRFSQPDRSFASSFNLSLIAQDQLPFRQSDWPFPQGYYYPLSVRGVAPLNLNLFPPPIPPVVEPAKFRNPMFIGNTTGQMGSWS